MPGNADNRLRHMLDGKFPDCFQAEFRGRVGKHGNTPFPFGRHLRQMVADGLSSPDDAIGNDER